MKVNNIIYKVYPCIGEGTAFYSSYDDAIDRFYREWNMNKGMQIPAALYMECRVRNAAGSTSRVYLIESTSNRSRILRGDVFVSEINLG